MAFWGVFPSGMGAREGNECHAALITLPPAQQLHGHWPNYPVKTSILLCLLKECDLWTKEELGWGLRIALQRATYTRVKECTMSQEWLRQTEFLAKWFTFMVCLKHVNDPVGLFSLLRWHMAGSRIIRMFSFSLHSSFSLLLCSNTKTTQNTKRDLQVLSPCE